MINAHRIRDYAIPLNGSSYLPELLMDIGERRFVLIGEASHGTEEFYAQRAEITKGLIEHKGFDAIVIEGDWPDSYEVNQYVTQQSQADSASSALIGFERFPTWMWRNTVVDEFIEWLKKHNLQHNMDKKVHFYGFDLYSLFKSIDVIQEYLEKRDPILWQSAKERFSCFDHCNRDAQMYGYLTKYAYSSNSCEEEVIAQLQEIIQYLLDQEMIAIQSDKHDGRIKYLTPTSRAMKIFRDLAMKM